MSPGEIAGLIATVALLSGLIGVGASTALRSRADQRHAARRRELEALSRWLAARFALTRSAALLVAAIRAADHETIDSPLRSARTGEAGLARARFHQARNALDAAEADIGVWITDDALARRLSCFEPVSLNALRPALHGEEPLSALHERLRLHDRRAVDVVRAAAAEVKQGKSLAVQWPVSLREFVARLTR